MIFSLLRGLRLLLTPARGEGGQECGSTVAAVGMEEAVAV